LKTKLATESKNKMKRLSTNVWVRVVEWGWNWVCVV